MDIIMIQETKLNRADMAQFSKNLYQWQMEATDSIGASGGLALLWKKNTITYTGYVKMQHWMAGKVKAINKDTEFIIINVYGPITTEKIKAVWLEINHFLTNQKAPHCIIGGDFNTILYQSEKSGGAKTIRQSQKDFMEWVNNNYLLEIKTNKNAHTWNNRRSGFSNISELLDRFFFKGDLSSFQVEMKASVLPWSGSDHFPVLLELMGELNISRRPFKFENMWLMHEDFLPNIQKWWTKCNIQGSKMFQITLKLKEIKHKLLVWNKERFKNIFEEKLRIEKEMDEVNIEVIMHGMDQLLYNTEKRLLKEYEDILTKEEIFWKQKSRQVWLSEGDNNTNFFHNSVKVRRAKNRITQIANGENQIITDPKMIAEDATQYFSNILNNWEHSDLTHS
ncbi:uncharacterized protein LOC131860228 [Cryptomeria japonica]|uniref:uncharacterized protein LOC131860228 n=1 Tax=Cryptomeria japonica TaxID=3369 RepID=UPI0027DA6BF0|nr:uncharacterized protein LOC131860228 [Cryptomeria japonica]